MRSDTKFAVSPEVIEYSELDEVAAQSGVCLATGEEWF